MSEYRRSLFWIIALFFMATLSIEAQAESIKLVDYAGFWKGDKPEGNPFEITVTLTDLESSKASIILSNEKELSKIMSHRFQERYALSVAKGILDYIRAHKKATPILF